MRGHGNNIPLDLDNEFLNRVFKDNEFLNRVFKDNEFLNRVFKDNINTFRQNITPHSIDRSSQSVKRVSDTLENFDKVTCVRRDSGHHVLPDTTKDFHHNSRYYKGSKYPYLWRVEHMAHLRTSLLIHLQKELHKWLKRHRKNASIEKHCCTTSFNCITCIHVLRIIMESIKINFIIIKKTIVSQINRQ